MTDGPAGSRPPAASPESSGEPEPRLAAEPAGEPESREREAADEVAATLESSASEVAEESRRPVPELAPGAFFRTAAVFYFLLALGGILWLGLARGTIPSSLFTTRATLIGDLFWGAAAGLALLGLWHGGRRLVPAARKLEDQLRELMRGVTVSEAIALAVISGVSEELFFRGAVQGSFGWLWATVIFALVHTGPGRVFRLWTLFALLAGAVFAALVEIRGTLLPAILAHAVVNGVNLYRMAREAGAPESELHAAAEEEPAGDAGDAGE